MSVEFLPEDEPGRPDGAVRGGPPSRHPPRRGRWLLAVVVLAAAALGWVITRPSAAPDRGAAPPSSAPPSSAPSSSAPSSSAPSSSTGPSSSAPAAAAARPEPGCRGVPDCAVRFGTPSAIAALARAYLPRGMRLSVRTVVAVDSLTHEDLLVERDIDAAAGPVTVLVRVERSGAAVRAIMPDPPGVDSLLLHGVNAGFVVRLQYLVPQDLAPTDPAPRPGRLRAFLRDPRLTAV